MSENVILLIILMGFIFGGGHAWWAKRRKTACALWLLAVWMVVCAYVATNKARSAAQKNYCIANLKQIDGAVQQWAQEHEKKATNTYSFSDLVLLSFLKGSVLPTCPGGGHYSPGTMVSDSPECSLAAKGHTL